MRTRAHASTALALQAHAARVIERCRELSKITDVPGQTARTFLSPATRRAQALLTGWMEDAGLSVAIDPIGNLHGLPSLRNPQAPTLMIGSHLDTVFNAGAFDGVLGILAGVAFVELLSDSQLPFNLEVVAFSEEEGVRFRAPFLGSLSLIGEPPPLTLTDTNGVTLEEALAKYGHKPTSPGLLAASVFAYLELHIEQGPRLESEDRAIAAVRGIAGQTRMRVIFAGQANHAGTTPMGMRRDALAAAAAWIAKVEARAFATPGLVATVGSIEASPGLSNVICGRAIVSLDLRHAEDAVRLRARDALQSDALAEAASRGVGCTLEPLLDQPAVAMDAGLVELLVAAAANCGYDAAPIVSGAGHDAMILARRVPSAMLFLRTPGGLSHHPEETVRSGDVEAALETGVTFLRSLSPPEASHA